MRRDLRVVMPLLAAAVLLASCTHARDVKGPKTQDNFGVQMAKMDLWREAMFRFQRAVEINPGDAMARNNLAVAYEANGDFEKARREYLEALKLDKSNQYIQKNYSRFVEFTSRNKKRTPARTASATPAAGSAATTSATAVPETTRSLPQPTGTEPKNPGDVAGKPEAAQPVTPAPPPAKPSDQPPPPVKPPQEGH
jgi:tetratricopeptide (TPR) repeat protein